MQKKTLTTVFLIFFSVSFVMFIGVTQIFGVPLWWIFSSLPMSIVQKPRLLVSVSPETPLTIGEMITVTVTNSSSQLPVEDAEVSVMKDGTYITTLYTDSTGQAFFEYFGEVTVVIASKTGIDSSMLISIPKGPVAWVRNTLLSLGIAVVGGFISGFTGYMFQKRKEKTTGKKITRKTKRKT